MTIKNARGAYFEEDILLVGDAIFNGLCLSVDAERCKINSGVNSIFYNVEEPFFKGISIESNAILSLGDNTNYKVRLRGLFSENVSYGLHEELERITKESNYKYEINGGARKFTASTNLRKGDILPLVKSKKDIQVSKIFRQMLDNLMEPSKQYIR